MKIAKRVFLVLNIIIAFFLLFLTISSINEYNTLYSATWTIKTPVGNVVRWFGNPEKDGTLKTISVVIIVIIGLLFGIQFANSIKKKRGFVSIFSPICDFFLSCCNMILCLNNEQLWSKVNGLGKNMIIFALIFGVLLLIDGYINRVCNKRIDSDRVKQNVESQRKVEATVTPTSNHSATTNYNPTPEKQASTFNSFNSSNDYNKNSFENNNFNNNGYNNNFSNSSFNNMNNNGYGNNQNYDQNNYGNNQQNNYYNQGNNNQPNPYMIGANDIVLNITVGPAGHQQTQRIILNTQNGYGVQQPSSSQNYIPEQPKSYVYKEQEEINEEKEELLNENNEFVREEEPKAQPRRAFDYDDEDDEEDEISNQGRGMSVNSLLSPTKVNAPAARKHGLRDVNKIRSEGGISASRTEKDEAASSAAKDLSKNVDLSAFGINLDDIKTEEDYKLALEKILGVGTKKEEVVVEDEPEPDDNDLDYELYQIEDSDLNMDELRELKLIIGDPSNMTFIEKFESADEEIRKRYLKLRYKLLSSNEKRLTSRITRYFDSYYYKGNIVARMTIQGKTIKLFLALDPKDYLNTKYSISDESNKLIYRNVPTLIRVRTDMSYEKGKRLISDMLNKKDSDMYEAPELKFEEKVVDFDKVPEKEPVKEETPVSEETKQETTESINETVEQNDSTPSKEESALSVNENVNTEETSQTEEVSSETIPEETSEVTSETETTEEVNSQEENNNQEHDEHTEENSESEDLTSEDKKHYDDDEDDDSEEVITKIRFASRDSVQETSETKSSENTKEFNIEYDDEGNEVLVDQEGKRIEESIDNENIEDDNLEEELDSDENEEESIDEEPGDDEFDNPDEVNQLNDELSSNDNDSEEDDSEEDDEDDGDEDEDDEKPASKPNPFANLNRVPGTGEPVKRKTFAEKIVYSEQTTKDQYSQLKSLLISYGMKSRVAKSNETFRFKKQLFVKITVQGKSLKVFLALNPDDYVGTKFPIKDMSYKASYSEVPLLIKVRSNLSFKRAKILIEELMAKKGILQGIYTEINYAELLEIGLE